MENFIDTTSFITSVHEALKVNNGTSPYLYVEGWINDLIVGCKDDYVICKNGIYPAKEIIKHRINYDKIIRIDFK